MASPIFEAPPSEQAHRRMLLISFHFPPSTGVGGRRWLAFLKFFGEHDWAADVVTRDPALLSPAVRDETLLGELPPGTRLFGVPAVRPGALDLPFRVARRLGLIGRARRGGETAVPAPQSVPRAQVESSSLSIRRRLLRAYVVLWHFAEARAWARTARRIALSANRGKTIDLVVSSGPPHAAHDAARSIARALGRPYIADFRDPWSHSERLPENIASPLWYSLAKRLEARIVRDASLVVMNTEPSARAMRASYPKAADKIITIWNGSDDEPLPVPQPTTRFTIRYAGTVYIDRDPGPLFDAAARVIRELKLSPANFGILFMGDVQEFAGRSVKDIALSYGVAEYIELQPPGSRAAVARFMADASMLISLPQDTVTAVPGKIFEYVRIPAWLLALADDDSATAQLLSGSGADVCPASDVDAITRVIREHYVEFASGVRPSPIGADGRFDRRQQAARLIDRALKIVSERRDQRAMRAAPRPVSPRNETI